MSSQTISDMDPRDGKWLITLQLFAFNSLCPNIAYSGIGGPSNQVNIGLYNSLVPNWHQAII